MGIVIINGKRYDSVTGLMLSDQASARPAQSIPTMQPMQSVQQPAAAPEPAANAQPIATASGVPGWVANYIDEDDEVAPAAQSVTKARPTISQPAPIKEAVKATAISTKAIKAAETASASTTIARVTAAPSIKRATNAVRARHGVSQSRTLNRRFVKKPLGETGQYAESMVEQRIKQATKTETETETQVPVNVKPKLSMWQPQSTPVQLHEDIALAAAQDANQDFIPMLTRRQAESLNQLNANQAPLADRVAAAEQAKKEQQAREKPTTTTGVQPAINLSQTAQNTVINNDDVLNERLSQLSQILQNVQELDAEQAQPASRKERKVTHASTKRNAKRVAKQTSHAKRRFRAPAIFATAGAMAVIAGIGVYVTMPTISVKMAANKAGIEVKNPYVPEGYTIDNDVAYQTGRVVVNYRSKSGNDGYSITQEKTDDTDAKLRQNVSEQSGGYYQELDANGQTVLMYRDKITWQKDGMRYTIDSNDYLDTTQITDIVKSL